MYKAIGLVAFNKSLYLRCKLIKNVSMLFDTQMTIKSRILRIFSRFIMSKSWNLRLYVRTKLYELGYTRCLLGDIALKILILSLVREQPEIFTGYYI